MFGFLEGFEKRMELVGVVESIVNRKNKSMDIERLFKENELINLVFSVLLYIMEKTLSEDSNCDSEHISKFLEEILPTYYELQLDKDEIRILTNYIIKNVLQNEGAPYYFQTLDYTKASTKSIPIRLITDRVSEINEGYNITYALTDQGYDFLFRTKEVDQEIKMTIEELKLRELIKRKNFKKAHAQSLNLIQMVRQKKKEIEMFMVKIKKNIHEVNVEEYEELIESTYNLLEEEYGLLSEIMEMASKSEIKIRQDYESSQKLDDSLRKAQAEIKQINNNIKTTLSEQKDLVLNRQSLSKVYINTIGDSFIYSMENRYDLEEVILKQMEKHVEIAENFWKIVNPLFMPNIYKNLNIRSIYEPQGMIKLDEEEKEEFIEDEDLSEENERERIEKINQAYVEILDYLLNYTLQNQGECRLEDVIDSLKRNDDLFEKFVVERLLFTTLLKLYDIGSIDIEEWRNSGDKVVMNLSEEFNLEYCLCQLRGKGQYIDSINKIVISGADGGLMEVEINRKVKDDLIIVEKVEISNFLIRVERNDEQCEDRN
ncbi:MAG: hypothetical protein PHD60_08645 [Clostridia bacterium]|nr:hypothetical protein [Clostridia bacterium]